MSKKDEVMVIIADTLGVDRDGLSDTSSPDTIEAWDSIQHLNIVMALEQTFGIQFREDQLIEMMSAELIVGAVDELC